MSSTSNETMSNSTQKDSGQQTNLETIINKLPWVTLPSPNWKVQVDQTHKSIIFSVSEEEYNFTTNNRHVILSEANNDNKYVLKTDMFMNSVRVQIPYIPKIIYSINELSIVLKAFSTVKFCSCYLKNHRENQCLIFSTPFIDVCSYCLQKSDCTQMCNKKEKPEKYVNDVGITTDQVRYVDGNQNVYKEFNFTYKSNVNVNKSTCIFCKQQFESDKLLKHHKSHLPVNSTGKFTCTVCNKVFDYVAAIVSHYYDNHKSVKFIKCNLCKQKYATLQLLQRHISNHAGFESFSCEYCNVNFTNKYKLMKHLSKHSTLISNSSKTCNICNKKYATIKLLHQHQREHSINKFKCRYCYENFDKKELLKIHKIKCNKRKCLKYTCSICVKKFSCVSQKLYHIKTKHAKSSD